MIMNYMKFLLYYYISHLALIISKNNPFVYGVGED